MRVVVLGAGLMGVTTAYELLRDGHEVVVLERNRTAAEETSGANAGLVAVGHPFAWASPKVPGILLKSLIRNDQAFRIRLNADPQFWNWTFKFLGQCTSHRARINTLRKYALCVYSQARLDRIVAEAAVQYHRAQGGILYFYRSESSLARGAKQMQLLAADGLQTRVIDRDEVARLDPVYAQVKDKIAGAVYNATDESGDSRTFTLALAKHCENVGAQFEYGVTIKRLETRGDMVECVVTDKEKFEADAYLLALGPYSTQLARSVGDRLPVYPVKGYSMTLTAKTQATLPRLGAVDEDNLVAYCMMGERLRATAVAEFAGYDLLHTPADFRSMRAAVTDLLPDVVDYTQASYRACLRPMTPHGTPIFGTGRLRNLYYNTGQGHMGWTMACGSARIAADLLRGRDPEIDISGMALA